ncbi:MAG: alginate lyase family protein [Spirosomataceae bacterium]
MLLLWFFQITVLHASEKPTERERVFTSYDSEVLEKVKKAIKHNNNDFIAPYNHLITAAEKALKAPLVSVMQKTQTPPSGDKHDYLSLAPYWWPDPSKSDGLPWIRKDGQINPLTRGNNVDEPIKDIVFDNTKVLAMAYYFSGDKKYANRAVEILQTFFLNPATKMNPNLNFAQGVPGVNTGRCFGIIEFAGLQQIITTIEMLRAEQGMDDATYNGMVNWLSEFVNWLQTSKLGLEEKATTNNHGTWYDATTVAILLFLKRDTEAKALLETSTKSRIEKQITEEGKQPEELARTKSLSYSIMNLNAFTNLAYFGKVLGVDIWHYKTNKSGGIQQAYEFLKPYTGGNKVWEYQQISKIEDEIEKLKKLFVMAGSKMKINTFCSFSDNIKDKNDIDSLLRVCL